MGQYRIYIRARLANTWAATGDFGREHIKGTIIALLSAAFGLPIYLRIAQADLMDEIGNIAAFGIFGPLAVIGLAFLIFWVLAPSRMHAIQQKEIANLNALLGRTKNNLIIWLRLDSWTLEQASWLWFNLSPEQELHGRPEVNVQFELLRTAILKKKLRPDMTESEYGMFLMRLKMHNS